MGWKEVVWSPYLKCANKKLKMLNITLNETKQLNKW